MPFDKIFFLEIPETEIDFFKLQYGSFKAQFEETLLCKYFLFDSQNSLWMVRSWKIYLWMTLGYVYLISRKKIIYFDFT